MKKILAVAGLTFAAVGLAGAPAMAGSYHHNYPVVDVHKGVLNGNNVEVPIDVNADVCGAVAVLGLAGADCR